MSKESVEAIIGKAGRIAGLDGDAKMSKSVGNTVGILAEPDEIWERVRTAVTDPQRIRRDDPGRPEACNVFALHGHVTDADTMADIDGRCRKAEIGCVDCKKILSQSIAREFEPFRERAMQYRERPHEVRDILVDGARRARDIASETMANVRERMGLDWRKALG